MGLINRLHKEQDAFKLSDDIVSVIMDFLHPKGSNIANNTHLFFNLNRTIAEKDLNQQRLIAHLKNESLQVRTQILQLLSPKSSSVFEENAVFPPSLSEKKLQVAIRLLLNACHTAAPDLAPQVAASLIKQINLYLEPKKPLIDFVNTYCKTHAIAVPQEPSCIEEIDDETPGANPPHHQ
jgi:hypothetical protein